ncbi:type 1 glutamine amidotransferase domain-containing protein [Spiroplasma cantharicola]|uniref:DJ-1/PfpI domain-containing protein n=1 Tax=Spiroplasma cantharicola TaxID=362837 RepID=A0A0M3SJG5_9MOLU|nr:type 1 glutamine amidotransferase domain-containing protein [Spiroplasma cantharicola]ALD66694.1 hypothetical protein SCANT_v1c07880 [Spiroplasma cantharicola]
MKVLIVLTNISTYGNTNKKTGLWLGEATEFIRELHPNFKIDFASPNGGKVPIDPRSIKMADKKSLEILKSENDFSNSISQSLSIKDVIKKKYDLIYFTGGHGVMWDFYNNPVIEELIRFNYENGAYISSVCHGIAALFNVKTSNGEFLIHKKKITGFTKTEEILSGKRRKVPFLNEQAAKNNGADFIKKRFFKSHVVVDGHIVTGQNPYSVIELAQTINKLLIKD